MRKALQLIDQALALLSLTRADHTRLGEALRLLELLVTVYETWQEQGAEAAMKALEGLPKN